MTIPFASLLSSVHTLSCTSRTLTTLTRSAKQLKNNRFIQPQFSQGSSLHSTLTMSSTPVPPAAIQPFPSPSLEPMTVDNTYLFLCDIQETFRGKIVGLDQVIAASTFLCKAGATLKIPILTTEQRPFKPTVAELAPLITKETNPSNALVTKSQFSMLTPEVLAILQAQSARRHIILFGIEAHVCVLQTSLDLLRRGYQVHLVIDGISSQTTTDRTVAFERLAAEGARVESPGSLVFTSAESVIYEIVKDAEHPLFKALVPAIKEYSAKKKGEGAAAKL